MNPFEKYLGPEDHVHIQICQYVHLQYKGAEIHHSPNEGKRTPFQRFKMAVLRVSAGFPDLFICWMGKTIAPEIKAGKNKPTPAQLKWVDVLNKSGIPSKVCTGYDETKNFIDEQFKNLKS